MPDYSTLNAKISYNIVHGREHNMSITPINVLAESTLEYRDFLLEVTIRHEAGSTSPTAMATTLYKPKTHYIDDDDLSQPVDKFGVWPSSPNAIPPLGFGPNPEFHLEKPDSDFELVKWINKYWRTTSGYEFLQLDGLGISDETIYGEWPNERYRHNYYYGHPGPSIVAYERKLRVAAHFDSIAEKYLLVVHMYKTERTIYWAMVFTVKGKEVGNDLVQASYIPIAIVYCPPGQDMMNSLVELESHGTRFTFGTSIFSGISSSTTDSVGGSGTNGFFGGDIKHESGSTDSQSAQDSSSSTLVVTKTHETMITANNQKAIGRAYWGPLGDLFVILQDVLFYASEIFDEETGYALIPLPQSPRTRKLILSTKELLQPPTDSSAIAIDWDTRKRILKLNPFVVKDDTILDEVKEGIRPLHEAVNPNVNIESADYNKRFTKVLSVYLGQGSDLNYYESTGLEINRSESSFVNYSTKFTSATGLGLEIGIPVVGIDFGTSLDRAHEISYQTNSELRKEERKIETAKCYLIRNQNDPSFGAIDLYYDKVFGTFLFKNIANKQDCTTISGRVVNLEDQGIDDVPVYLFRRDIVVASAYTNHLGFYTLDCFNLKSDAYRLVSSGISNQLRLTDNDIQKGTLDFDITGARKIIDLSTARYLDLMDAFDITIERVGELSKQLKTMKKENDILNFIKLSKVEKKQFKKFFKIKLK